MKLSEFTAVQWVSILLIVYLVLHIVLMLLGVISRIVFWAVLALIALIAYKVIPNWRE